MKIHKNQTLLSMILSVAMLTVCVPAPAEGESFQLKSKTTDKMYGPYTFTNGCLVDIGGESFTLVTAKPRSGLVAFSDGKTRRFASLSGVQYGGPYGMYKMYVAVPNKLVWQEYQGANERLVPIERLAAIAVQPKSKKDSNGNDRLYAVQIESTDGIKEELVVEAPFFIEVGREDSIASSRLLNDDLLGVKITFNSLERTEKAKK